MSVIQIVKCDNCGKRTDDYMNDEFIIIEGSITKYGGRNKNRCAFATLFLSNNIGTHHFCSWKCLETKKN